MPINECDRSLIEDIEELANTYLRPKADGTRTRVISITVRECDTAAEFMFETERYRVNGELVLFPVLEIHPETTRAAWSLLGSSTLRDCIVTSAEIVDEGWNESGPIYAWNGVRYGGRELRKDTGFVARCCGTLVTGPSVETTIRNVSRYRLEIGDVDWSKADIAFLEETPLRRFNSARVRRLKGIASPAVELHAETDETDLLGLNKGQRSWRPTRLTVLLRDDGTFIDQHCLIRDRLLQARQEETARAMPKVEPISEDDLYHLAGTA